MGNTQFFRQEHIEVAKMFYNQRKKLYLLCAGI